MSSTMNALPTEMLVEIFQALPGHRLPDNRLVCRRWNAVITDRYEKWDWSRIAVEEPHEPPERMIWLLDEALSQGEAGLLHITIDVGPTLCMDDFSTILHRLLGASPRWRSFEFFQNCATRDDWGWSWMTQLTADLRRLTNLTLSLGDGTTFWGDRTLFQHAPVVHLSVCGSVSRRSFRPDTLESLTILACPEFPLWKSGAASEIADMLANAPSMKKLTVATEDQLWLILQAMDDRPPAFPGLAIRVATHPDGEYRMDPTIMPTLKVPRPLLLSLTDAHRATIDWHILGVYVASHGMRRRGYCQRLLQDVVASIMPQDSMLHDDEIFVNLTIDYAYALLNADTEEAQARRLADATSRGRQATSWATDAELIERRRTQNHSRDAIGLETDRVFSARDIDTIRVLPQQRTFYMIVQQGERDWLVYHSCMVDNEPATSWRLSGPAIWTP